ncbi:MAG: DUF6745 domain-containing protein [Bryobacteraceae bacterium]
MPSPAEIRAAWLAQLFSTEPADRPRAQAAVAGLYAALGLPAPRHFLWFDGPLDAAWAAALLIARTGHPWDVILRLPDRTAAQRATMERIREHLRHAMAAPDWPGVLAAAGSSLESLDGKRIFEARLSLYPDVQTLRRSSTFSDDDDLHRAEGHFRGIARGVLGLQESARPVGVLINHSPLSLYPVSIMAADEAQAAGGAVPPLLAALWEIACSSGPWFGFEHAVILTDRPAEIHLNDRLLLHSADGPAAVYRDGWRVHAWEGEAVEKPGPPEPFFVPIPPRAGSRSARPAPRPARKATARKVPARRAPARKAPTRKARPGGVPYLDRYLAGEYQQVWADLIALGPAVREAPHAAGAQLVAQETMRRVAANVRTVVGRLHSIGYRFKTQGMWLDQFAGRAEQVLDLAETLGQGESKVHHRLKQSVAQQRRERKPSDYEIRAHVPPGPQTPEHLRQLDELAGPVPLSLAAFYEIVGSVDLMGYHPAISPPDSRGYFLPDPLVIFPLDAMLLEYDELSEANYGRITLAPDAYHKADFSGGAPYEMALPDARADGELLNERHKLFFVDYLRLVFRHGGFPGYEGIDRDVPAEIVMLGQGLQPF